MITITIRELMILVTIWFLWMATVAAILDWLGKRTIYKMEKEQELEKVEDCNRELDEEDAENGAALVEESIPAGNEVKGNDEFSLQ